MSKCTIYLGNDTGPMHMAAAAGVGVVGVFGPTDTKRVGPWTKLKREITAERYCDKWPCEKRKCRKTPFCIDEIPPDEIAKEALSLIGELS